MKKIILLSIMLLSVCRISADSLKPGFLSDLYFSTAVSAVSASGLINPTLERPAKREIFTGSTGSTVPYKFTNLSSENLVKITIIIPVGFTYVSCSAVSASSNKTWLPIFSGGTLSLNPASPVDYLSQNEYIQPHIIVATQAEPLNPTKWNALADFIASGTGIPVTEVNPGDMQAAIISLSLTSNVNVKNVVPTGTFGVTAQLQDDTNANIPNEPIIFSIISGVGSFLGTGTGTVTATTDTLFGKAGVEVITGASDSVTVRASYISRKIADVSVNVISTSPSLTGELSFIKNGIIYGKTTTNFTFPSVTNLTTEYSKDGGIWTVYSVPITFSSTGTHTVSYRFIDESGIKGSIFSSNIYITPSVSGKLVNYPNPFSPINDTTRFEYYLDEDSKVSFDIFTLLGSLVWNKTVELGELGGRSGWNNHIYWDGKNLNGVIAGNGGYILRLTAEGSSSTKVFTRKICVIK
jgi:hypothetical protein